MGYALFAQRKLVLTSQLNSVQLQQTQRSNEQFALATKTAGLQQQLSSLGASQAAELADLYAALANVNSDGSIEYGNLDDTDAGNVETALENVTLGTTSAESREAINAKIKEKEQDFQKEQDAINREIYQTSIKENAIEMEIKNLDTQVTALQEQLQAVQDAEAQGIKNATPKFKGMG